MSLSRRIFSAQDGPRKKFKIRKEPPGNELSEYVFLKFYTMSVAETAMENVCVAVVKGSPEFPRPLDLSNGDVSRFKKTLGP